jgi:Peptidase family C50
VLAHAQAAILATLAESTIGCKGWARVQDASSSADQPSSSSQPDASTADGAQSGKSAARQWWDQRHALDAQLGAAIGQLAAVAGPALQRCLPPVDASSQQAAADAGSSSIVLLTLGAGLHGLPWEAVPELQPHAVYRILHEQQVFPPLPAPAAVSGQAPEAAPLRAVRTVDAANAVYVVDPRGDLSKTRERFEAWFAALPGWRGSAGAPALPPEQLRAELARRDLFVFLGHGAGAHALVLFLARRAMQYAAQCQCARVMAFCAARIASILMRGSGVLCCFGLFTIESSMQGLPRCPATRCATECQRRCSWAARLRAWRRALLRPALQQQGLWLRASQPAAPAWSRTCGMSRTGTSTASRPCCCSSASLCY